MPPRRTPPRALVVEDDADIRALLTLALEDDGWRVLATDRALDPGDIAQLRPDVVVLDLHLRDGTDGWVLLEGMRTTTGAQRLPVVVCTADHGAAQQAARSRALGADLLLKPFYLDDLREAVAEAPAAGVVV